MGPYDSETRRHYPTCCTSAFCGASGPDCNSSCGWWPTLQEFKTWERETAARCVDEIWSPTIYHATRERVRHAD